MEQVMKLFKQSFLYHFFFTAWQSLCHAFFSSYTFKFFLLIKDWVQAHILNSRLYQYLFNPIHITNAWYKSLFYRRGTYGLRKLSLVMPKPSLRWSYLYIGSFLAFILLIPQSFATDTILQFSFTLLALFYFAHFSYCSTGTVFGLINIILVIFWAFLAFAVPYNAAKSLAFMLMGIDLFFLISFAIRTREEFDSMLCFVFLTLITLCLIGFIQNIAFDLPAKSTFPDGISFGEIIVLLFPFAFIYPMKCGSKKRGIFYMAVLIMLTFHVVTLTTSKAALIGYATELILLIFLIDIRYFPVLIFLGPALTGNAINSIIHMWDRPETYGNFFTNIIYSFKNFWDNGFGVNRTVFMDIYNSTAKNAEFSNLFIHPEISRTYFLFIMDMGAIFLILFLTYILKIAHSALISLFTAPSEYRPYFAAGFVTLIGISVSSMLESAIFAPRTLMIYWAMLGLLRGIRIIRYGITR